MNRDAQDLAMAPLNSPMDELANSPILEVVKEAFRFAPKLRSGGRAAKRRATGSRIMPRGRQRHKGGPQGQHATPTRRSVARYLTAQPMPTVCGEIENLCLATADKAFPPHM